MSATIPTISPYKTSAELAAACNHALMGRWKDGRPVPPGERVRLTQTEVAARLGVNQASVAKALSVDDASGRYVALRLRILREIAGLEVEEEPRYYVAARP